MNEMRNELKFITINDLIIEKHRLLLLILAIVLTVEG